MGFLDQVTGLFKGTTGSDSTASVLKGIAELVDQSGGLAGMAQKFQAGGFGEVMKSWIGTGKNLPISADQIQAILGSDAIGKLAQQTGLSPEGLKQKLTGVLPNIIDRLTPDGQIPAEGISLPQILNIGKQFLSR